VFPDLVGYRRRYQDRSPQLVTLFDRLRAGDTLAVWRLDRLGRSLPHLIEIVGALQARGVGFKSVRESIDTTTPAAVDLSA